MTQPEHPFKDLPEGAVVTFIAHAGANDCWDINLGKSFVQVIKCKSDWVADADILDISCQFYGPTPDAAFQALRQAVRDLAHDLGVG